MASLIPWRRKKAELARKAGEAAPSEEFPFLLSRMRDEFDRLLERFATGWEGLFRTDGEGWRWDLEVKEEDDAVVVTAEAPGFEPGDFDVQVTDGRLTLRTRKKEEVKKEKDKHYEYREQECFESVELPTDIDRDKVEASYHNGVLTVRLPKTAEAKGKRVPVKSA